MKIVIAIIKPHVTEKVLKALSAIPTPLHCVLREVKGYGRQKNYLGLYRGSEYSTAYLPKICIIFSVPDEYLDVSVDAVVQAARSGRMGDGKIFVLDAESGGKIVGT